MLDVMRDNLKSLQFVLWLVILAFIISSVWFFGQGGSGRNAQNAVAWVNDEPVSMASFDSAYRQIYGFYRQIYGDNLTDDVLKTLKLDQAALQQLTENILLAQQARAYNISVSDEELVTAIQKMPQFQTNNQFDGALYKKLLARIRTTPQEFENQTESELLREKMRLILMQTAQISDQEALAEYAAQNDKISIDGMLVNAEKFTERVTLADTDTQTYYDAHKQDFTTPPRVKIHYLRYDPQTMKADITPTEEDIRAYYDANEEEFNRGPEVKARHILFRIPEGATAEQTAAIRAKAEDVLKQAQGGADFAELAQANSEDTGSKESGGDLGFFGKGQMVSEFENAAFALQPGQISEIIQTQFGLHILKVDEKREETDPYAKAKPDITERLKAAGARDLAAERAGIAYDDLMKAQTMQDVAAKDKLEVNASNFFGSGEPIDEKTGVSPQIQEVALTLSAEQKFSEPIETPTGFYLIEFVERKEPYVPELAEIKEKVTEAARHEKAKELAKAEAEAIQNALTSGTAWDDITKTFTAETFSPRPFSRRQAYITEARGKSEELAKVAFGLRDGEYSQLFEIESDFCVVRVKERIAADMTQFEKEKAALKARLLQQKQQTLFREFVDGLKQQATIEYAKGMLS